MNIPKKILAELIVFVLLCVGFALYYGLTYKYHFFWQEQNQIFLLDGVFMSHYFDKPAWLGCLAGDFLTQFYYYLYAGPAIFAVVLTLTLWFIYGTLSRMMPKFFAATLAICAAVWIVGASFSQFFRLSALMCIMGGVLTFPLCQRFKRIGLALVPIAYWMFGFGCLVTAALYVLKALSRRKVEAMFAASVAVVLALLTPMIMKTAYTLHYAQALLYPEIPAPMTPDSNFEANLGVENEYYFGNYDKALHIAKSKSYHDDVSAMYFYLINAKRDSLPDYLLYYGSKNLGTLLSIGDTTPRPIINVMNDLYYELGDMTFAERAAMMRNVFSDQNRNVRMIKRLAEINLTSGDTLAAKKYLRILSRTHAYRSWASRYLDSNDNIVDTPDFKGRKVISAPDTLRIGDNCRTILLELLDSDPDNTVALDYLLCTDLLLKEMDTFKADYDRYCMDRGSPRDKTLYQQALMIYLAGTDAPIEEWQKYITSETQLSKFKRYNKIRRPGTSQMYFNEREFTGTYWYYFDKVKLDSEP